MKYLAPILCLFCVVRVLQILPIWHNPAYWANPGRLFCCSVLLACRDNCSRGDGVAANIRLTSSPRPKVVTNLAGRVLLASSAEHIMIRLWDQVGGKHLKGHSNPALRLVESDDASPDSAITQQAGTCRI